VGHSTYGAQISATLEFQNFSSENCSTALSVGSYNAAYGALTPSFVYIRTGTNISAAAVGIEAAQGGRVRVPNAPTFTTVTNELSLDGTFFSYSTLSGASPSVISNSYGSSISR
jgi:hypothetical protein